MAKNLSERLKKAEETLYNVQQELKVTNEALDMITTEKNEMERKHEAEQARYSEMQNTYPALADELIIANRGKREVEALFKKEQEKVQERDKEIQKLKAEIKRMDTVRPSSKVSPGDEKKQLSKLAQQL